MKAKITKRQFLDWYFMDDTDINNAGCMLYEYLYDGKAITVRELFDTCGYIEVDGVEYDPSEVELID